MKRIVVLFTSLVLVSYGQRPQVNEPTSMLSYNVLSYNLDVDLDPEEKHIKGYNTIKFVPIATVDSIRVELQKGYSIDSVLYKVNSKLEVVRKNDYAVIKFKNPLSKGSKQEITIFYGGSLVEAQNPPWGSGGFVISEDSSGKPWISTACQGTGAGCWWPSKLGQADEPEDGMDITIRVPSGLTAVSNGHSEGNRVLGNGKTEWRWKVQYPINNYCITVNVADYVHFGGEEEGIKVDYYVLKENIDIAKPHFKKEVPLMLKSFNHYFGKYPFSKDGYKIVETPFLGMEHQSAIAYGNGFQNGYMGKDLSGTGIGLNFDFIIVHESGHEWFGNSITGKNLSDLWIHEGFTTYAESLYVRYHFGDEKSLEYVNGLKKNAENKVPIIPRDKNATASRDMYFKGALMLNTIRSIVNNDETWWKTIKDFYTEYKYSIISTNETIDFFDKNSEINLKPIFEQYLMFSNIPILQLEEVDCDKVRYRWKADVPNFKMPFEYTVREGKNSFRRIGLSSGWRSIKNISLEDIHIDESRFYINIEKIPDCEKY